MHSHSRPPPSGRILFFVVAEGEAGTFHGLTAPIWGGLQSGAVRIGRPNPNSGVRSSNWKSEFESPRL
eukprot:3714802-Rhodomonas_salina.1